MGPLGLRVNSSSNFGAGTLLYLLATGKQQSHDVLVEVDLKPLNFLGWAPVVLKETTRLRQGSCHVRGDTLAQPDVLPSCTRLVTVYAWGASSWTYGVPLPRHMRMGNISCCLQSRQHVDSKCLGLKGLLTGCCSSLKGARPCNTFLYMSALLPERLEHACWSTK